MNAVPVPAGKAGTRVIDFIGDWLRGKASDLHKDVAEQGTLSPHLTQTRDRDLKTVAAPSCREQSAL